MKKYITGGIAALITLTAICMMTGQSQTSSHQQSVGDAICHQQNQGVIVCPGCQGKGNIGGQKCQRCKGRGILKSNGMPLFAIIIHPVTLYCSSFLLDMST